MRRDQCGLPYILFVVQGRFLIETELNLADSIYSHTNQW